jgi:putative nucleotidyltransferase with HDIG domain
MEIRNRIPLDELKDVAGRTAEDVLSSDGAVLVPRGSDIGAVLRSIPDLPDQLRRRGIGYLSIVRNTDVSFEEFSGMLDRAEPSIERLDPDLARHTLHQVQEVYQRIVSDADSREAVWGLVREGQTLAREVAKSPQILLCLGRVRSWDEYTFVHSLNVSLLGSYVASHLVPERPDFAEAMAVGGLLHDLGKASIPLEILNKPGRLTEDEFAIMRRHPEYGEAIARKSGVTDPKILSVVRSHHERWDACGYPDGTAAEAAPLEARIAAVVDVFDALTTKRIYKDAMESRMAVSLIVGSAGTHFDGSVVRALLRQLGLYPPGTVVELSDYSIGVVVGAMDQDLVRPKVIIELDGKGRRPSEDARFVDLGVGDGRYIIRAFDDLGKGGNY